jgi:hypothetical protein
MDPSPCEGMSPLEPWRCGACIYCLNWLASVMMSSLTGYARLDAAGYFWVRLDKDEED